MSGQPRLMERAFEIARSGSCASLQELRRQLRGEGYGVGEIEGHTQGSGIKKQLNGIIAASRQAVESPQAPPDL